MKQKFCELFSLIYGLAKNNFFDKNVADNIMYFEQKINDNEYKIIIDDRSKVVWKINYIPDKKNEYDLGRSFDTFNLFDLQQVIRIEFKRIFISKGLGTENSFSFVLEIPLQKNQKEIFLIILTTVLMKFQETFQELIDDKYLSLLSQFSDKYNLDIITFDQIKSEYLK